MRFLAPAVLALACLGAGHVAAARSGQWKFAASLDGRPIGEHVFDVREVGDAVEVESRASFDVRVLGFSLYTYEHRATEVWKEGCLASLSSRTDDNGTVETVTGTRTTTAFEVTRDGRTELLPSCTMTFAYWNPGIRTQTRLLNPQTGELVGVSVGGGTVAKLDGRSASRWVISGENLEIEVWYDAADDRWLALDSKTSGGGLVSYRVAAGSSGSRVSEPAGRDASST